MSLVTVFGSKYELLEKLADGGMGEVFLARVTSGPAAHTRVAIKRILPQLAAQPDFVEMFLQETHLGALLWHDNIVRIYDHGRIEGYYFLAMEYVEGRTLRELLRQLIRTRQPASRTAIARLIADVAAGLHHAHTATEGGKALEIVHRDVSPANIIVSFAGVAKISDFGLAKARSAIHRTGVGMIKGKWAYMSPEQLAHKGLDRRSDIFSLGIVLYELCTLTRLFVRQDVQATMDAIARGPLPPPSSFVADFPEPLERIIMRCLERDPERRYQDAAALRDDLERFVAESGRTPNVAAMLRTAFASSPQGNLPRFEERIDQTGHSALTRSALARRRALFEQRTRLPPTPAAQPNATLGRRDLTWVLVIVLGVSLVSWTVAYLVFR